VQKLGGVVMWTLGESGHFTQIGVALTLFGGKKKPPARP